ncbi:sugar phosphate isomerase/epimerase family protein [Thermosporothrix hazakensis]|jgi:sugar phosphate isomerase/epimerase|nr:sugar phosphate isomerase/epimerase family protein [Thermosporothrix hazakensis]
MMKFGICASFRQVAAFPALNVDYLEENVQHFLMPERSQEAFAEQLREARRVLPFPIEVANVFFPGNFPLLATPERSVDRERVERYVRTVLRRAEEAGIRVIVFGSGGARACPEGYERAEAIQQIADYLATWSDWGKEHGVRIALEPLRYQETNVINTVAEGGELVASIATSGAGLLVDTYHMASNREAPASIAVVAPYLAHVHVAELEERSAPGVHGEDFRPYFSVLQQCGYDQRISIECHWKDMATEVGPALETIRAQWMWYSQAERD